MVLMNVYKGGCMERARVSACCLLACSESEVMDYELGCSFRILILLTIVLLQRLLRVKSLVLLLLFTGVHLVSTDASIALRSPALV